MGEYVALDVTTDAHVAHVVLRGPGKGNALGPDFWREMPAAFAALDQNRDVHAIVLSGAGGQFTYGLDLAAMRTELRYALDGNNLAAERTQFLAQLSAMQQATLAMLRCDTPIVAAISGWCIGAGIDVVCAADVRVCSSDAQFSVRAVRVGIVEDVGSLQLLPRIVGEGAARELALTGMDVDAEYARAIRLVNHVEPTPDAALARAHAIAARIAANPALVVRGVKRVMNEFSHRGLTESLHYTALWNTAFMQSHDFAEALAAFRERRPPHFQGR